MKETLQQLIVDWYVQNGRPFYWRTRKLTEWQWLVLELLLTKTRAETVNQMFPTFISKYSEPQRVLDVSECELTDDLRPLGLYRRRSQALRKIANKLVNELNNILPSEEKGLSSLPQVGPYISRALLCFCYEKPTAIVDVNVKRVLSRVLGINSMNDAKSAMVYEHAQQLLPQENWKEFNYGLLDIGALFCTSRKKMCKECPLIGTCHYAITNHETK